MLLTREALNLQSIFKTGASPLFGYKQHIQNLAITPPHIVTFSPIRKLRTCLHDYKFVTLHTPFTAPISLYLHIHAVNKIRTPFFIPKERKKWLLRSAVFIFVCVSTLQLLNHFIEFPETCYEHYAIRNHPIFNFLQTVIKAWWKRQHTRGE
jgi:hypothetical protein